MVSRSKRTWRQNGSFHRWSRFQHRRSNRTRLAVTQHGKRRGGRRYAKAGVGTRRNRAGTRHAAHQVKLRRPVILGPTPTEHRERGGDSGSETVAYTARAGTSLQRRVQQPVERPERGEARPVPGDGEVGIRATG